MKRKILVTLLAFCLIASLCVVGAAADSTTLPDADEGVMTLTENVTMSSSDFVSALDTYYAAGNKELIIDLGQNTLTVTGGGSIEYPANTSLTIENGNMVAYGFPEGTKSFLVPGDGCELTLENVTINTDGAAIFPAGKATAVTVINSNITGGVYAIGTNASTKDGELVQSFNVRVQLLNSTFSATGYSNNNGDTCTVMLNVPGTLIIDNCIITGHRQAVFARGGDVTITDSTIALLDPVFDVAGTYGTNNTYISNDQVWLAGNEVPLAAMVIGNRVNLNQAYQYPVDVEISNTTISANEENDAIYAYEMTSETGIDRNVVIDIISGEFGNVTIENDDGVEVGAAITGGTFTNSVAAYVADGLKYEAKSNGVYTYHRTIESAVAAAGSGGSVSMISDGAAVGPDDEGVHTITLIDGGSEITMTVTNGYVYTLPELDKSGYTFVGWRLGNSNTILKPGDTYTVSGDTTFTAVWNMIMIPDTYDIAVDQPAHGTVDVSFSNASQGSVITVTATPDEGYELVYITVDGEPISGNSFVMPDHAVEVSALFAEIGKEVNFVDVSRADWFYDYVQYVAQNGLMEGTTRTAFEPNASMTRAMFWTVLARIDGETITGDAWKTLAQTWAVESGISDGTNADALITREQMVTMLYRYAGSPVAGGMAISEFTDGASVSDYATDAVTWALSEGILTGMGDGILAPQGTATRAQAAAMLMRFVEA